MPGIYLHFRPSGLATEDAERFERRLATRATRRTADRIDRLQTGNLLAAAVHHGRWPSSGAMADDDGAFLLSGSCWLDADHTELAPLDVAAATYAGRRRSGDLEPLRGMHALAHLTPDGRQLSVETDRFGTVPVYYRDDGHGGLLVASEIKFLVEPGRESPDVAGLSDLLSIGYHVRPATAVSGVTSLPLHHRLVFDGGETDVARLPVPGFPRDVPVDRESLGEIDALAARHFQRFAGSVDRMSVALSGGLDSRLLLYSALRCGIDVDCFTAGERGNVDVAMVRRLTEHLGLDLTVMDIQGHTMPSWLLPATWLTEGRVPFNHIHYFQGLFAGVTPPAPQIHGLIGEAAIGGYLESDTYQDASGEKRREGCHEFARACAVFWAGLRDEIFSPEVSEAVTTAHHEAAEDLLADLSFQGSYSDYLDFVFIYRGGLFGVPALGSQVVPWTDIISPFLDGDFFDFGARLKSEDIRDRRVQLRWGLELMPGFADLPRIKDGLELEVRDDDPRAYARAVAGLKKRVRRRYLLTRLSLGRINPRHPEGFPHYAQWYRRWPHVRKFIDGILLDERTADRGLWRADGIRTLLSRLRTGRNLWGPVGALLLSELLCRMLVDGDLDLGPHPLDHADETRNTGAGLA